MDGSMPSLVDVEKLVIALDFQFSLPRQLQFNLST
jgi:hypothetical protein